MNVDHPRSGVVYNFGRVCLSVCQTITFESLHVGISYILHPVYLQGIRVKFVYEGHPAKVKVTNKVEISIPAM